MWDFLLGQYIMVDDREVELMDSWGELAAIPILGVIVIALIFASYKVLTLLIANRKDG
jgi:hypothetical protein